MSRMADKGLPFFKVLRKAKAFKWTAECEKAFQQLKAHLRILPRLISPVAGDVLCMYLAATEEVVGSVLFREEARNQMPIYFVIKVLAGPETRFLKMEKLVFSLIITSRRLIPYFQAYTIVVYTDKPLKQVLHKYDVSGRLLKWAIKLSEFDLKYAPRVSIKG